MSNATTNHRTLRVSGLLVLAVVVLAGCGEPGISGPRVDDGPLFHAGPGDPPVSLSGLGTATIDGVISPGEWSSAGSVSFPLSLPQPDGGGTTPGTLYVMNDATTLYLGLRVDRPGFGGVTLFNVEFDNDHDGARDDGDDVVAVSVGEFSPVAFFDAYRFSCDGAPANSAGCSAFDPSQDGMAGAALADSGFTFLEMAHPLASGDFGHDFSLSSGQIVGFQAQVRLFSLDPSCNEFDPCAADTSFPPGDLSGANFGDIVIADSSGDGDSTGTTTLAIEKTAEGFGEHVLERWWWIGKGVNPPGDTIPRGETHTWDYTIAVVAGAPVASVRYGVRGQICVSNTGSAPVDSMVVSESVQYLSPGDSNYQGVPDLVVNGSGAAQLQPGDTHCFAYEATFTPVPGGAYRNVAQALIQNHDGHSGEWFGPEFVVPFTLPDSVPAAVFDTTATITDVIACPRGFTCTPSDPGPWQVAGDDTLRFTAEVTNDSAPCGQMSWVTNRATLAVSDGVEVPSDPFIQLADSAAVLVSTGDCAGGGGDSTGTTTLAIEKTAEGFGVNELRYTWWMGKDVNPPGDTIPQGETRTWDYSIAVVRFPGVPTVRYGARGQICVANTGSAAVDSLSLSEVVQYRVAGDSAFHPAPDQFIDGHPGHVHLEPGDTLCFEYQSRFTPVPGAEYRNVAQALIENYVGHPGELFGPEVVVEFTLPESVEEVVVDSAVTVIDALLCPPGFTCTPSDSGPWYVAGDDTLRYTAEVRNDSAPCGLFREVDNFAAMISEDGLRGLGIDSAAVVLYTGPCGGGCTRTIGFWKTHAGLGGNNPDLISPLLPVWLGMPGDSSGAPASVLVTSSSQAAAVLGMSQGRPSNGITKLYAQLLATKLNVAAGASPSTIVGVIAAADAFLAVHDQSSWTGLTKSERAMVLGWVAILDRYNKGEIGPGVCD